MKKLLLPLILLMSLTACGAGEGFGTFKNPADSSVIDKIGLAYRTTLDAAVTYRDICDRKIIARSKCAPIVVKLDAANQKVLKGYRNLRIFSRENPTIDAISLVTALKDAVDEFKALASQLGVQ